MAGEIFSSVFTYWILLLFHFYFLFNSDILYMIHKFLLILLSILAVMFLKTFYYRARPWLVCEKIFMCECEPANPSGHAGMAVMVYYVAFRLVYDTYLQSKTSIGYRVLTWSYGTLCFLIMLATTLSRLTLGVHTYMQLIIGWLVSISIITFLDLQTFKALVSKNYNRLRTIGTALAITILAVVIGFLFINNRLRNNQRGWQYWSKCPKCNGSFVRSQTENTSIMLIIPALIAFFPVVTSPTAQTEERLAGTRQPPLTTAQKVSRYFLYLALYLPTILLLALYQFAIKPKVSDVEGNSLLCLLCFGLGAAYLGFAITKVKNVMFAKFKLDRPTDFYFVDEYKEITKEPNTKNN